MSDDDDGDDVYGWGDAYHGGPAEPFYWPRHNAPFAYDRKLQPIDVDRYMELHCDRVYADIRQTVIRRCLVSTVWLGIDYRYLFDDGPPVIFETMIFVHRAGPAEFQRRSRTERQAWQVHSEVCRMVHSGWRAKGHRQWS